MTKLLFHQITWLSKSMITHLSGKETDTIATSTEEFTWLDYLDPGVTDFDLQDTNFGPVEASGNGDSDEWPADSEDMSTAKVDTVKESKSEQVFEKELEQHAVSADDSQDNEATDLKEEISSKNSWADETPLQVQDSEVLLLPYEENASIMDDSTREGPSLGGDNFQTNEVADSGLMVRNSSESDSGEVDHSDNPLSIAKYV